MSPDCKYLMTELRFEVNGESFSVSGKTVLDAGFTRAMHWSALPVDESMPDLRVNQHLPVNEVIFVHRIDLATSCRSKRLLRASFRLINRIQLKL